MNSGAKSLSDGVAAARTRVGHEALTEDADEAEVSRQG